MISHTVYNTVDTFFSQYCCMVESHEDGGTTRAESDKTGFAATHFLPAAGIVTQQTPFNQLTHRGEFFYLRSFSLREFFREVFSLRRFSFKPIFKYSYQEKGIEAL